LEGEPRDGLGAGAAEADAPRMRERLEEARLALEARARRPRHAAAEDLQGDGRAVALVARPVDDADAALAEARLDDVGTEARARAPRARVRLRRRRRRAAGDRRQPGDGGDELARELLRGERP